MEPLFELILSDGFYSYLKIRNRLGDSDLLRSLVFHKAVEHNVSTRDVNMYSDPLEVMFDNFNWLIASDSKSNFCEDDRLDITIKLLAQRQDKPAYLQQLLSKINVIYDFYLKTNGKIANSLASLASAITYLLNTEKEKKLTQNTTVEKPDYTESKMQNLPTMNIYASLSWQSETKSICYLHAIEKAVDECVDALDVFIEGQIFPVIYALNTCGLTVTQLFSPDELFYRVLKNRDFFNVIQVCIYDKGKNVTERLVLFQKVFQEQNNLMVLTKYPEIDVAIQHYQQRVTTLLASVFYESYLQKFSKFGGYVLSALPVWRNTAVSKQASVEFKNT